MTYVDNLLETVFSTMVANSEDEQCATLREVVENPDARQRDGLRTELMAALTDPEYDWDDAFERNEVYPDRGQSPRQFVVERIWAPLFGRETLPQTA